MFLFRSHKKLSHKQVVVVGFVLAVMSILVSAIMIVLGPLVSDYIYAFHGNLETLFLVVSVIFFLAVQGLILFGFPLYYAQDKKSHMTGLQILVYALLWQVLLMAFILVFTMALGA